MNSGPVRAPSSPVDRSSGPATPLGCRRTPPRVAVCGCFAFVGRRLGPQVGEVEVDELLAGEGPAAPSEAEAADRRVPAPDRYGGSS